jgi:hypothetical protein
LPRQADRCCFHYDIIISFSLSPLRRAATAAISSAIISLLVFIDITTLRLIADIAFDASLS